MCDAGHRPRENRLISTGIKSDVHAVFYFATVFCVCFIYAPILFIVHITVAAKKTNQFFVLLLITNNTVLE